MAAMSAPFINASTTNIVSKITMSAPKVNGSGGKNININFQGARLMIRLPEMMCWGVDDKEFDGKSKMSINLQFPSAEKYNTPELAAVLANLQEFEDYIKQQAIVNSKEWLNKGKISMDVVEALFTPFVRRPRNENGEPNLDKAPSFQVKIPTWDGRCDSEVFDSDGNMLFPNKTGTSLSDLIPKQTVLSTLITCGGIWFGGGKFGVTFKLRQAVLKPKTQLSRGVCHILSDDSTKIAGGMAALKISKSDPVETITGAMTGLKVSKPEPEVEEKPDEVGVEVADSDEERVDPENPAAAAEPDAPVKGRKKVVKK